MQEVKNWHKFDTIGGKFIQIWHKYKARIEKEMQIRCKIGFNIQRNDAMETKNSM